MPTSPRSHPTKARQPRHASTAETIGRRILGGDLPPGATLPNAGALAQQYKLSRPALREAIKILAAKGLLSAAPRRGTVVRPRSDWNRLDDDILAWEADVAATPAFIRDLFEIRRMVEPEAAALTARRITTAGLDQIAATLDVMAQADVRSEASVNADIAFHRALLLHSGNELLASFAPAISASLRIAFKAQRSASLSPDHIVPPHRSIYDAIRARQENDARSRTLALLHDSENDALEATSRREA